MARLTDLSGRNSRNITDSKEPNSSIIYQDKPFARHYNTHHIDCENPKLELKILKEAATTTDRKIEEARMISNNMPDLNNREEQADLRKYLVWINNCFI